MSWRDSAACRDLEGPNLAAFMLEVDAEAGETMRDYYRKLRIARYFCGPCPVQNECLAMAFESEGWGVSTTRYGVFGNMTPTERRKLAEKERANANP